MDNKSVLLRKAREELEQGHLDRAAERYEKVLHEDGHQLDALVGMARIALATDSFQEARNFAERALEKHPDAEDAKVFAAIAREAGGDLQGGLESMLEIAGASPKGFLPAFHAGRMLAASGRFEEALTQLQRAAGIDAGEYDVQNLLGNVLQQLGRLGDAVKAFTGAIKITPQRLEGYIGLADALTLGGETDKALEAIDQARTSAGEHPALWLKAAGLLALKGDFAGALKLTARVCERLPDSADAWVNAAWLQVMNEDIPKAEEAALRARKADPEAGQPHFVLGMVYEAAKLDDKAEAEYRQAVAKDPEGWEAPNNLGLLLLAKEQAEAQAEAEGLFRRAIDLAGAEGFGPRLNLAIALAKQGKREECVALCDHLLADGPPEDLREQLEALKREVE